MIQKLSQLQDDAALAALGPPPSPIVLPELLARSDQVETGDFAGEVTRFVLPLREGDLAALCDGKALEILTGKRP